MEIMVAIGIVAVICLLVIGTLARLLSTGGKSSHQTAAGMLAQEVLDSAVASGPPTWGFSTTNRDSWRGQRSLLLPGDDNATPFDYKIEVLPLRKSPEDLGTVSQVTVTVWWWGEMAEGRVDQGQTSVTSTRTVYVRGEVEVGTP
jgi:type II secretory pathway pseudopilin PulG